MNPRFAVLAGVAVTALATAPLAGAAPALTPKTGVFGSPASGVCLVDSPTPERCLDKVGVFPDRGVTKAYVIKLTTGCDALDAISPFNSGTGVRVRNGRFTVRRPATPWSIGSQTVTLKTSVTGVFATPRKLELEFGVQVVKGRIPGCRTAAFAERTATVRWFAPKDNGG